MSPGANTLPDFKIEEDFTMLDGMMQQQDDVNRIFMGNSLSSIGRELNSGGKNTVGSSGF